MTYEQLQSTRSYQEKNLGAINLGGMATDWDKKTTERRDLAGWDFTGQNLQGASFFNADVSNAIFDGAIITNADFSSQNGFENSIEVRNSLALTKEQLYSTASYQQQNLQGVGFNGISVAGWNFVNQDLTGADFGGADVTGTDFTDSVVKNARFSNVTKYGFTDQQLYSTASYKAGDLSGMWLSSNDLSGWDFGNKNLTNTTFNNSTVTDANFGNSTILGANVSSTTFSVDQLYSTASYNEKDLRGVSLNATNLKNSIKDGSNLDLSGQNLQNASLLGNYENVNLTNADLRGASITSMTGGDLSILKNTIWSDGVVKNASLAGGNDVLVVKNYVVHTGATGSNNPYVITTKISDDHLVATGGVLRIETGAPLALVQHKSLAINGGSIHMIFGDDQFGVVDVYTGSEFTITDNTNYVIDFGLFEYDQDEYLMVDITHGGIITGLVDSINYSVFADGQDVTNDWEFAIANNGNLIIRNVSIPEPSSILVAFLGIARLMGRRRK